VVPHYGELGERCGANETIYPPHIARAFDRAEEHDKEHASALAELTKTATALAVERDDLREALYISEQQVERLREALTQIRNDVASRSCKWANPLRPVLSDVLRKADAALAEKTGPPRAALAGDKKEPKS
jgi:rubrerythrin